MRRYFSRSLLFCLLFTTLARAELPPDYKVVLLTENFPPFNMADNNKNFARDKNINAPASNTPSPCASPGIASTTTR